MRQVQIFEEHASVLAHWFSLGASEATVIYLDAHLDLQFVGDARMQRLRQCQSAGDIARLESPHPQSPNRAHCFGIEDFLLPAAQLGLIRRVIWVAPPHVLRGGLGTALAGLQQMEGVTIEDLESFRRVPEGWLCGRLLGVELTVCQLPDLSRMPLKGQLLFDIDADYFVSLPQDAVWIHPRQVVDTLTALPGIGNELTISRSVGTGFMPLQYRFIADHVAAIWQGDQVAQDHWDSLLDLMREGSGHRSHSSELFARLLQLRQKEPTCAATCFFLALASGSEALRASYLAQAANLDAAYGDNLVQRLGEYQARCKQVSLSTVITLQREVDVLSDTPEKQATAWILLGQLYAGLNEVNEATYCDSRSMASSGGHPDLALVIAHLYLRRGAFALAEPYLQRAGADDETRVGAWLQMAESAFARRDVARALEYAEMACRVAPAWAHLRKRFAAFASAGSDAEMASNARKAHDGLLARLQEVAKRLQP
jgi:tetratricopeptide (TPR) repeat protein